jgi:hypothetical protein
VPPEILDCSSVRESVIISLEHDEKIKNKKDARIVRGTIFI